MDRISETGVLGMEKPISQRQPDRRSQWLSVMEHTKR
nr:MAG TPA: hypothetical protein [Bacteriophage sp.]